MSTTATTKSARKASTRTRTPKSFDNVPETDAPASKPTRSKKATAAPKAKAEPRVKKSDIPEEDRDWTYLAEKDPTDLHVDFAAWLEDKTGLEVDLKTVQAVCVLRMVYQRSESNKKRSTYRGLDETVVDQRSVHMIKAHQDAREIRERQAKEADAKKAQAKARRTRRPSAKSTPAAPEATPEA